MTQPLLRTIEFLGIRFADCDLERARDWVLEAVARESFAYVVTPNVDHVVQYHRARGESWHQDYRDAVHASDLCLNDSRILQRLSRISGERLPLAPGSDLVRCLIATRRSAEGSVTLIGGSALDAQWLAAALPRHRVHHFAPPMGVRDDPALQAKIARFVEHSDADIAFFAIGAPQSEIVAHLIARRGAARGVGLCIGASIEFLSGRKRRAPRWMQQASLEWLFRLGTEPARLWRRYLFDGPRIFFIWCRARRAMRKSADNA
ncbi:WecB/TagA/CpsF family glycosyltransferase [Tsuneonella sp. HG249]